MYCNDYTSSFGSSKMAITVINSSLVAGERHLRAIEIGKVFEIIQNKDHFKMTYVRPGESEASQEVLFGDIKVLNDHGIILLDQKLDSPGLSISKYDPEGFISLGFGFHLSFAGYRGIMADSRNIDTVNGMLLVYEEIENTDYVRLIGEFPLGIFLTNHWNPGSIGMYGYDESTLNDYVERMCYRHDHDLVGILFNIKTTGVTRKILKSRYHDQLDNHELKMLTNEADTMITIVVPAEFLNLVKLENWNLDEYLTKHH